MAQDSVPVNRESSTDEERAEEVARIMANDSLSQAEKIEALLGLGYSAQQVENEFGFKHATVFQTAGKVLKPAHRSELDEWDVPSKLDRYQMIPPEQTLKRIHLQDGEYKQGFIDGISILLLAGRYNQMMAATQSTMMDPMIKLVQAMKREERDAAEKARGEGQMIARETAQDTAGRVVGYVEQRLVALDQKLSGLQEKKPAPAPPSNPSMAMMGRAMESSMTQLMGGLLKMLAPGMAQPSQPGAAPGPGAVGSPGPEVSIRRTVERGSP